jgi:hypothetical protein
MCLGPSGMLPRGQRGQSLKLLIIKQIDSQLGAFTNLYYQAARESREIGTILKINTKDTKEARRLDQRETLTTGEVKSYHSAAVLSHQFCLRQNVSFHGGFNIVLGCAGL